jgi:DNA-binding NtrC family response regulator
LGPGPNQEEGEILAGIVLIVDDDANLLESIRRTLRREPYSVTTCQSGEEALSLLKTLNVDVIVSDREMPGMSGLDLLRLVRDRYPAVTRFMLTGKATLDSVVDALNNGGISRLLLKPCDPLDLIMSIRQGLQQHKLMIAAFHLMKKNARQTELLRRLEMQYPNITRVDRDADGAITLDDFPDNADQLLNEIEGHLKTS